MCENYISATIPEYYSFATTLAIFQKYVKFNDISKKCVVKLSNRCALKLEKATKCHSQDFFHAICLGKYPMTRNALKHKHMASKFNPGIRIIKIKKLQSNNYLLKKLIAAHFFSIIVH